MWFVAGCGLLVECRSNSLGGHQPSTLFNLVDAALHVKIRLGHVVVFAVQDFLEAADGLRHGHRFALPAGEDLGDGERLAEEPLNLAGAEHGELVVRGQFVHAENGDDVLEILVTLQHALEAAGDVIVFATDDVRGQGAGGGGQRIHGRVNAQFGDGSFQHDGRVQVGERRGGGRVGQVVGGHVHRLEGGDRTFLGGGDAFLQVAHFGGERRLVPDGAGGAAE